MMAQADGEGARPIISLFGEKIALGPQHAGLEPLVQRWLNDFRVSAPLGRELLPLTIGQAEQLYIESESPPDQIFFTVYERETLRPLGITGLKGINHASGGAEFVIFLGERDCWGKGYGTETTELLLRYGFDVLGLRSVFLRVFDFNVRGMRAYLRAGFREVGRRRQAHRLGQDRADAIVMECVCDA